MFFDLCNYSPKQLYTPASLSNLFIWIYQNLIFPTLISGALQVKLMFWNSFAFECPILFYKMKK